MVATNFKVKMIEKLTNKTINQLIGKQVLENPDLLNEIETIFKKKRKKIIDLPKPGSSVILLVSGGLDSSTVWYYLMKEYGLIVYPIFFNRGQKRVKIEREAVEFFGKILKKKYPLLYREPKYFNVFIPPMEIRFTITKVSNNPINDLGQWRGIPAYTNILYSYALQYAQYIEITTSTKIRTIFGGFVKSDGKTMTDQTLTAIRAVNLSLCATTGDFSWQVIALPIEKELGFYYDKPVFIKWATKNHYPIEKSRTCIEPTPFHCGTCVSCIHRKHMFELAKVKDKTIYHDEIGLNYLGKELKALLPKSFKNKVKAILAATKS